MILDPKNVPIPLVDDEEWRILRDIHTDERVVHLGDVSDFDVTRGEINQRIFRKYITSRQSDARLMKGVEIGSYRINKVLS
jgi:hypothetical protein